VKGGKKAREKKKKPMSFSHIDAMFHIHIDVTLKPRLLSNGPVAILLVYAILDKLQAITSINQVIASHDIVRGAFISAFPIKHRRKRVSKNLRDCLASLKAVRNNVQSLTWSTHSNVHKS
jgi:hypothetical protein